MREFVSWLRQPSVSRLSVLDQFFVGASSGLLVVAAASSMSAAEVGQFGLAYTVGAILVVIIRGGFLARLTMIPSHGEVVRLASVGLKIALPGAAGISLISLFIIWILSAGSGVTFLTLLVALSFPVVIAYEILRYVLVSCRQPRLPVVVSLLWFTVTAIATGFSVISMRPDITVVVWLSSGVLGALSLFGGFQVLKRSSPNINHEIQSETSTRIPTLGHFNVLVATQAGAALAIAFSVFALADASVWAQIVVLNAVLYPLSVLTQTMPLLVRASRNSLSHLVRKFGVETLLAGAVIASSILWFMILIWVIPNLVASLMGETWLISIHILWIATLNLTAGALLGLIISISHYQGKDALVRRVLVSTALLRVVSVLVVAGITQSAGWIIAGELAVNILAVTLIIIGRAKSPAKAT